MKDPKDKDESKNGDQSNKVDQTKLLDQIKKLKEDKKSLQTSRDRLADSLADNDVVEILRAKEKGQNVRMVIGGEEKDKPSESDDDIDGMVNTELKENIIAHLGGTIGDALKKALEPITKQIKGLEDGETTRRQGDLNLEVMEVRAEFPDLEKYKDKMNELRKTTGDKASIRDLYLLSRIQAGDGMPIDKTGSEKPTTVTMAPVDKDKEKPDPKKKRDLGREFDTILKDATNRLEIPEELFSAEDEAME